MLAARFYGAKDIRLEDVPVPTIKQPDEILLEIGYCGICGTDLHEYLMGPIVTPASPHPLTGVTLPQTMGHEFGGTVAEVGPGVTGVKPGDRVSVCPAIVCGDCDMCRQGLGQLCTRFACTGLSAETGALAQYAIVTESQVFKVPDAVTDIEAAVMEPACVAAYGVDRAGVVGGDVVLITGAGPIGILSAMYADAVGASTVVISEPNANRAALAKSLDIGPVIDPSQGGLADFLADLTGGSGVDLAIECSGSTPGLEAAVLNTRRRGNVVQTGLHTKPATVDMMRVAEREITIIGSWAWNLHEWPRIIRLVASGKFPISRAVTSTIPLADVVTKGFDVLVDPAGDQVKVLVSAR